MPGWSAAQASSTNARVVGILPGEGIGPEVIAAAVDVLGSVTQRSGIEFDFRFGGPNRGDGKAWKSLTDEITTFCQSVFDEGGAILCGPGGERFVYELRTQWDLFCKFTPIRPLPALADAAVLRPEAVQDVNLVVVRENTGGMYFGQWDCEVGDVGCRSARHAFAYRREEVTRIVDVATRLARQRRRRIALIVKPGGVPTISRLWTEVFQQRTRDEDLATRIMEVDHASYQVIASARDFDVLVAPNMFGDIISDGAALLLGSRGLSFSGNFGGAGRAVYQTGHGAAQDIAGRGIANPIGQILSAAMMLRESFGMPPAAAAIETAIARTVARGIRTPDIATPNSTVVGTREMGELIADAIQHVLPDMAIVS